MPDAPDEFKVLPHPKLKRDYVGRTVRTLHILKNGYLHIPKGSIVPITSHNRTGSTLRGNPCKCCGVQIIIRKIQSADFEFVERITPVITEAEQ